MKTENVKVFCFQLLVQNPPNRKTKMKLTKRSASAPGFGLKAHKMGPLVLLLPLLLLVLASREDDSESDIGATTSPF